MRIGIIDDDREFIAYFESKLFPKIIKQYSNDKENSFISSQTVLTKEEIEDLDILFLDIQLENKNSVQLLLNQKLEINTKFVFLSSKNSLVFDALKTKPLAFIRKSHLEEDFNDFLKIHKNDLSQKKLLITMNKKNILIPIDKIVYISACGHDITLKTTVDIYTFIGTMKGVMSQIHCPSFVQIQKSAVINLKQVSSIERTKVNLKDGSVFEVSRFYKKELSKAYVEYLLNEPI